MITYGGADSVWVFVLFDLPVDTPKAIKQASKFRINLKKDGFTMMQYSVYARHCGSEENAEVHHKRVKNMLPPDGEVRMIQITDKQFARMQVFWGKRRKPTEIAPLQLDMF